MPRQLTEIHLQQGSANYGPQVKSGLLPVFVEKYSFGGAQLHSFVYELAMAVSATQQQS